MYNVYLYIVYKCYIILCSLVMIKCQNIPSGLEYGNYGEFKLYVHTRTQIGVVFNQNTCRVKFFN